MESPTGMDALTAGMERMEARLEAAAALLERTAALMEERESAMSGDVQKIVAAVETSREAELQRKLESAEEQIAELRAQITAQGESPARTARKTIPAATVQFLSKQGLTSLESVEAGALDAALSGLSLEQRIAVKAQLLRAGVAG